METLTLTLNKKLFNMVLSGEKKEDYREVKKHWVQRLVNLHFNTKDYQGEGNAISLILNNKEYYSKNRMNVPKSIEFRNGCAETSPSILVECLGIEIGGGRKEWGAKDSIDYFVIKLGKEISRLNC